MRTQILTWKRNQLAPSSEKVESKYSSNAMSDNSPSRSAFDQLLPLKQNTQPRAKSTNERANASVPSGAKKDKKPRKRFKNAEKLRQKKGNSLLWLHAFASEARKNDKKTSQPSESFEHARWPSPSQTWPVQDEEILPEDMEDLVSSTTVCNV